MKPNNNFHNATPFKLPPMQSIVKGILLVCLISFIIMSFSYIVLKPTTKTTIINHSQQQQLALDNKRVNYDKILIGGEHNKLDLSRNVMNRRKPGIIPMTLDKDEQHHFQQEDNNNDRKRITLLKDTDMNDEEFDKREVQGGEQLIRKNNNKEFHRTTFGEFLSGMPVNLEHASSPLMMTCGYQNILYKNGKFGLQCGITNQLFELTTCLMFAIKFKAQFKTPNICVDGNWGLCACEEFKSFSEYFDFNYFQSVIENKYHIPVIEHAPRLSGIESEKLKLKSVYSPEVLAHQNGTLNDKPMIQAVKVMKSIILEKKKELYDSRIINLGYVWGRWRPSVDHELAVYSDLFSALRPSATYRNAIKDYIRKIKAMDKSNHVVVMHVQYPRDDFVYLGCQQTLTEKTHFITFLSQHLQIPKGVSIVLVGVGFELLSYDHFHSSSLYRSGYPVHLQHELSPIALNRQFESSLLAFWLALESDLFISTACETQFASHIMRMRQLASKRVCSSVDVQQSSFSHIYPQEYLGKKNSFDVPYFYPFANTGKYYTVPKCTPSYLSFLKG